MTGGRVSTVVNGDAKYRARTTRRAVELLLSERGAKRAGVRIEQTVETPIGSGFGASAAAATSAVYAVASAFGLEMRKEELAEFAHRAEILEQTGLGTVSVIYDSIGAGAITVPGEPGEAKFNKVDVPRGTDLVTAFLAPYDKKDALSSKVVSEKINRLGHSALEAFMADPTLDTLAYEGERFSDRLGLESPEVRKLIERAKSAGADYASQNIIGYSIHSIVNSEVSERVAESLRSFGHGVRVDVFQVGTRKAGII
jgi:pantoate kinase